MKILTISCARTSRSRLALAKREVGPRHIFLPFAALILLTAVTVSMAVQGGQTLFGDVRIRTKEGTTPVESVTVVLYGTSAELGRQIISNRGRYRFSNLKDGDYEIALEVGGNEIGRLRNIVVGGLSNSPYGFQFDLDLEWKPLASNNTAGIVSAEDVYKRSDANQSLFDKAEREAAKKKYDQAAAQLQEILKNDKSDFQAWNILGTIYRLQEKDAEAEKAYLSALELKPTFGLALLNLGRLRSSQKKFEQAIDPLTRAVESHPQSAEANLLLGEAYLQLKKGSRAVPYLEEAARLGRFDAYLRLGWLYNAAGLKDRAAAEYQEFLKKKPDYADRRKLEEYISANKPK
jgi:tetratricopeptide (TPR) repeat protein